MKAAAHTRYGLPDIVQIMEVEKPVPQDNEVHGTPAHEAGACVSNARMAIWVQ